VLTTEAASGATCYYWHCSHSTRSKVNVTVRCLSVSPSVRPSKPTAVRHDTIWDAILTRARKPTWVSLIYRTEPTTKKWRTCCRFAAVGPAGMRYRSTAARPALSSSGVRRANAGSATLSAYVGSWTETCRYPGWSGVAAGTRLSSRRSSAGVLVRTTSNRK